MIRGVGGFSGKWWRLRKEKIQEKVCKILVLLNTAMPEILRIHVATVAHPSTVHILYSKEIRFCRIGCTQLAVAELMFSCWWWLATGKLLNWTRPGFKFAENASKYSSNSATSTTTSSTSTLGEVNKTQSHFINLSTWSFWAYNQSSFFTTYLTWRRRGQFWYSRALKRLLLSKFSQRKLDRATFCFEEQIAAAGAAFMQSKTNQPAKTDTDIHCSGQRANRICLMS